MRLILTALLLGTLFTLYVVPTAYMLLVGRREVAAPEPALHPTAEATAASGGMHAKQVSGPQE